jgi:hypothetical protein
MKKKKKKKLLQESYGAGRPHAILDPNYEFAFALLINS